MENTSARRLVLYNMWVMLTFFGVAILLGVFQVVYRGGLLPQLQMPELYFGSVSTHGVLMGFVITTFMVMASGYFGAVTSLKMEVPSRFFSWLGFLVTLSGVLVAAVPLLTGQASVMYTFYPPLKAHPAFYIGATLLVVGSWFWVADMLWMLHRWRKANPGENVPLIMFGTVANAIMWFFTSLGVAAEVLFQLIPWSLGLIETVDVGLARTLFSWTLHAIVYFWLFPAYIAAYTIVPKEAGGPLFSDEMARIVFIMLLVFSIPIGFHHLYMDPFQAAGWKFLHMTGTFMVAVPTLFTGFTLIASLEMAGRLNGGGRIIGWLFALPWRKPIVTAACLALLMLTFGGFGGLINASYAMNAMVHNTQWITGHFHLIFAGTTVIMYFGIMYYMLPKITGHALYSNKMALIQLWLWFVGMLTLTLPWHLLGIQGQPRRISSSPYPEAVQTGWELNEMIMVAGGVILMVSALMLIYNLLRSHSRTGQAVDTLVEYAVSLHPSPRLPRLLNTFGFWTGIVIVYLIASYAYPIVQFFILETHGIEPWGI